MKMLRGVCVCALVGAFAVAGSDAYAQAGSGGQDTPPGDEKQLPTDEVVATREAEKEDDKPVAFTSKSIDQRLEDLDKVPGGADLITDDLYRDRRAADLSDVLRWTPAVYSASRFGNSETRVVIRGSGLRRTFNLIGVRLFQNGIPISEADGNARPQLFDPLTVVATEVYPGGNGLTYGSSLLGGAINFITPTGYDADQFRLRLSSGSDDFQQVQASSGAVLGNGWDYFVSGSQLNNGGFRQDQSQERVWRLYGNIGKRWDDTWETRIHFQSQDNELELPGSLTRAQIRMDPTQPNGFWRARDAERNFNVNRFDVQHTGRFSDGSRLDIGVGAQWLRMHHPLPFLTIRQERTDIAASVRYTGEIAEGNELVVGGIALIGYDRSKQYAPGGTPKNNSTENESMTYEVYIEDRIKLGDSFTLIAGLHGGFADREETVSFDTSNTLVDSDEDYSSINPKIGFLFDASDTTQFYGSISKSWEPPTDGDTINQVGTIDDQTGWTAELGARGRSDDGKTHWQVTGYYSLLDDEILTIQSPPNSGMSITGNADDTVHYGLEVGFEHFLDAELFCRGEHEGDQGFRLRTAYTYTVLRFSGDDSWHSNALPGIPPHLIRSELVYEHPCGFYIGANFEMASTFNVDFANTLRNSKYAIWGATAGYRSPNGWTAFIDAQNLTDRHYASNTGNLADAGGMDTGVFNPGRPFSVFGGIEVTFGNPNRRDDAN